MKEQLVTLEIAVLAEEKGCEIKLYDEKDWEYVNSYGDIILCNYNPQKEYPKANRVIYCPQSLLQKWLRDNHMIRIYVEQGVSGNFIVTMYTWPGDNQLGKWVRYNNTQSYNTYEEALEKGLQEALKLIKS